MPTVRHLRIDSASMSDMSTEIQTKKGRSRTGPLSPRTTGRTQTLTIRLGKRGTVVIPVEMRRTLGIGEGDALQATVSDGKLTVIPIPLDPVERFRRAGAKFFNGVDAVAYVRELRDEWDA